MANVRDSDTSLWLHNKLGISNDSWTGGSICSQLNVDVLRNIKSCFPDLQTQVKLKLLLSIFHIPRRNVDEWRHELEDILYVALNDSEQWVSMLAETMRTLPSTGSLNLEIRHNDDNMRIFSELVNELRKLVRKQTDSAMLPLECHYLNRTALTTVVGQQPPLVKHFSLKRKPKSAALRAELLTKSADAANTSKKNTAPTVPVRSRGMPRKMTDTTPLKGIPSRVPTGGFRSPLLTSPNNARASLSRTPLNRKDGGIKIIEITEQPLGFAQAKKRKRMQEIEDARKAAEAAASQAQTENKSKSPGAGAATPAPVGGTGGAPATPTTPDYAIGLAAINPPTPAKPTSTTILTIPTQPSTPKTPSSVTETVIIQSPTTPAQPSTVTVVTTPTILSAGGSAQLVQIRQPRVATASPIVAATPQATAATTPQPAAAVAAAPPPAGGQPAPPTSPMAAQPAQQPPQKKGLSLTREQMVEAQEMFRTANIVTRPEKALILGFMAGSRDNPCPHLGNIVTIKLSESKENVEQEGTVVCMMVETHFQMNYNTGEWKRIRKLRKAEDLPVQTPASASNPSATQQATA